MRSKLLLAAIAAFGFVGAVFAQTAFAPAIPVPLVPSLNQNDVVQVLPRGVPSARGAYANPGWIGGLFQYSQQTPLTGFSITVPAHTSFLYLTPAGTLATGTITMEANPSDGQNLCFQSTQVNTAITYTANTGQSFGGISNGTTYATANTRICWLYNASTTTWYRYQ